MKKTVKILSVILVIIFVTIPFTLTASAVAGIDDAFFFAMEVLKDLVGDTSDEVEEMSGDEFANWYLSMEPDSVLFKYLYSILTGGPFTGATFAGDVSIGSELLQGEYQVATVNQNMLNKLKDSANSFLKNYYKDLRVNTFEDFHLQTYDKVECQSGTYLGLDGSGSFVHYGKTFDGAYYNLATEITAGQIALYTGSNQAPWCIYVPQGSSLYQNGFCITNGNAWVLPLDYDTVAVLGRSSGSTLKFRWESGNTIKDVYYSFDGAAFGTYCSVYRAGQRISDFNHISEYISNYDFVSSLTNMINVRLNVGDGSPSYKPVELPSDIPYDDDNNVVVCVPVGDNDGRKVIYMNPKTYNNYIDNGDIVTNNNNMSDYYDDSTVNNFTNVYNNYDFDDSTLIGKLEGWFDDVNKNLGKIVDRLDTIIDTIDNFSKEPVYATFSDCMFNNVPALGQLKNSIVDIVPSNIENVLAFSFTVNGFGLQDYNVYIDFGWYEPYRERVRNILRFGVYIAGIGAWWRGLRSVFGINGIGGGD